MTTKQARGTGLSPAYRSKINQALNRAGLDGNTYFDTAPQGLTQAMVVLGKFGIEQDQIPNSYALKRQPEGRLTIDLAFSNQKDPFSPAAIDNTMLVYTWHRMESGRFECIAYLS